MILRDYQQACVENCVKALEQHKNTLAVAPTGAGKTIILSALIQHYLKENPNFKILVVAHRNELIRQNREKFLRICPQVQTSIVAAAKKDWQGQVVFAMVQTLSRSKNLADLPKVDLIVIDECHHIMADSYLDILHTAKKINPNTLLFGVTATPNRGDKQGLGTTFSNCAYQIDYATLIGDGYLVEPKVLVSTVMQEKHEELAQLTTNSSGEYRDSEVAGVLDTEPVLDDIVEQWQRHAQDRKTVIFCSTVKQARHVQYAFSNNGINAALLTGETTQEQRDHILNALTEGVIQIVINVLVLTEGWDYPPISCVVLLKMSSFASTYLQMVGRGLRTIDTKEYPKIDKKDCIILDFGISSNLHFAKSGLDHKIKLHSKKREADGEAPTKECKKCKSDLPLRMMKCPFCGYVFLQQVKDKHNVTEMLELKAVKNARFAWDIINCNGIDYLFASGFFCWVAILNNDNKSYVAIAGHKEGKLKYSPGFLLYEGCRSKAIYKGNAFILKNESPTRINKDAEWRSYEMTDRQYNTITEFSNKYELSDTSRGLASSIITFQYSATSKLQKMGFQI